MTSVLNFQNVSVIRNDHAILSGINWVVNPDERWAVIGPNGAGKTTLLQLASAHTKPTTGLATVVGESIASDDVTELRTRLGFSSSAVARLIPDTETVLDAVMTAAWAVMARASEQYDDIDEKRAMRVLAEWKLDKLAARQFGTLSDGEQKRVQIARSIMTDPEILFLDEPAASLDLGSREELLLMLDGFASMRTAPAMILVTHHVDEIPAAFTHALVLKNGSVVSQGRIQEVLTSSVLSEAFGTQLHVEHINGRFSARGIR
ncbi:MAG: ABC transporter ATP-binding protein [Microbacteriaceae bacterium]